MRCLQKIAAKVTQPQTCERQRLLANSKAESPGSTFLIVITSYSIHYTKLYDISNISERMHLYRELDNIENEADLIKFENNLMDRFGPLPDTGQKLLDIVRIRKAAKALGIEKVVFKNQKLYLYLVADKESCYFQSATFGILLQWVQNTPLKPIMKEGKERLYIHITNVRNLQEVKSIIENITPQKD